MHGGDGLDRASKIGVLPPEDDNPMITQHTQFLRRAEGIAPPPITIIRGSFGSATPGSSAIRVGRIVVLDAGWIFDTPAACRPSRGRCAGGDRHFAVPARYIQHVGRLAQPGDPAPKISYQTLAGRDPGAEMRRATG